MIASDYLDYRARLDATIGSLAEAARRSGAHAGRPALLRNLMAGSKDPFMFVIAGESGAGKSMFLNALAGEEFCDPAEGAVAYFRFGDQAHDVPGGTGLIELYRPCEFLRDFHLVELPGTESGSEGAKQVGERFVAMADLVLAVISVADAWTTGVWNSIDHVRLGLGKDPLVILTACDLRSEEEIRAVVEHMELTMRRRYGATLPIFPMSAENAFLARTNPAAGGEAKLAQSGLPEFEQYVSQHLLNSEVRMSKFEHILQSGRAILDELHKPLDETEEILGKDGDLLEGLKSEINTRYEKTNEKIRSEFFGKLDEGHAAAVEAAQAELSAATGWGSLPRQVLRGGRHVPEDLGKNFLRRVVEATEERVIGAMSSAEIDITDLWETLEARVAQDFDHRLTADDGTGKAVWSGRGENLLRRAEACAEKACGDFSIEETAKEQLRSGAMSLRFFVISALVLAVAAGILFAMDLQPSHLVVGGLSVVALGFGAGQFIDGRRKLKKALADRAEAGRIQLRADLSSELTSHVHEYYTKLGTIFDPVQELCQRQVEEVSPQIAAVRELDTAVDRLADELASMRESARDFFKRLEREAV